MAIINIDDAYILDETGAQVDKVTGLYFKNENASDTEKAQARANIGAGGTNDNLLDNAYFVGGGSQLGDGIFPINQRGQTSYTAAVTGFDRWKVDGNFTATLESSGVRTTSTTQYVGLSQIMPAYKLENGETYTYSIVVDGVLHTATFVANNDGNWANIYYGADWYVPYRFVNGAWEFKVINSISSEMNHLISNVKIEKGTYSTLLNDVPPDYGEELAKCQRYLKVYKFPGSVGAIGFAYAHSTTNATAIITLPVSMRATPTISVVNAIALQQGTVRYNLTSPASPVLNGNVLTFTSPYTVVSGAAAAGTVGALLLRENATLTISAEP